MQRTPRAPETRWIRRSGFTLTEVMIALVLSAIVVSLAYGTLQGGFDVRDRVDAYQAREERDAVLRTLLSDALRHAVPGVRAGERRFSLVNRTTTGGVAADSLEFATRGVVPPFGASAVWTATVWSDGSVTRFAMHPHDPNDGMPLVSRFSDVRSLDVRILGRGNAAQWSDEWATDDLTPEAVSYALLGTASAGERTVVRVGLERER